jgi:hypothetical protein
MICDLKSPKLAYAIGALQGDGCLYQYKSKTRGRCITRHILMMEAKDIEMVKNVAEIFAELFGKKRRIYKKKTGVYGISYSVKTELDFFKELGINSKYPPKPPEWIGNDSRLLGAYLAGLIDADGNVCLKRPKYPQCRIRIISSTSQKDLKKSIETVFNCSVSVSEFDEYIKAWKRWTHKARLEFVISPKNMNEIKQFVLPYLAIPRKRKPVLAFIKMRKAGARSRTGLSRSAGGYIADLPRQRSTN